VLELFLARIDEHRRLLSLQLDQVAKATEPLAPEMARWCRNAITMASVMIDELHLRPTPTRSSATTPERMKA
jgi:hypothetical protein